MSDLLLMNCTISEFIEVSLFGRMYRCRLWLLAQKLDTVYRLFTWPSYLGNSVLCAAAPARRGNLEGNCSSLING